MKAKAKTKEPLEVVGTHLAMDYYLKGFRLPIDFRTHQNGTQRHWRLSGVKRRREYPSMTLVYVPTVIELEKPGVYMFTIVREGSKSFVE